MLSFSKNEKLVKKEQTSAWKNFSEYQCWPFMKTTRKASF